MRGRADERGAALLEIVIALGIAAMLAAAASGAIRAGLATLERAGDASTRSAKSLTIRRDLAAALTRIDAGDGVAVGDEQSFRWRGVVAGPDGFWRAGWRRLSGDALTLETCEGAEGPCAAEDEAGAAPEINARFAYAAADGLWRDDWPEGPAPALIRVTIDDEALIFAPRVRGAAR